MDISHEPMTIKLFVVGDRSVGKKRILFSYTDTDRFSPGYVPTVFENYTTQVSVDSKNINLSLWDMSGQETYGSLKSLSFGQADIVIIVFSVIDQNSFDNALNRWFRELNTDELKKVPKIIVGNKIDLRNNEDPKHIKSEAARQVVQQNCPYFECSALTQEGLKPLFDQAIREVLKVKANQEFQGQTVAKEEKPCCIIQ